MNAKKWLPLVAAVALGLIALVVAKNGMPRPAAGRTDKTVRIVVAKDSIGPGQQLAPEQLALQPLAAAEVSPDAFTDIGQVAGRVTLAPMVAGQTVMNSLLAAKGAQAGLAALVPHGMRAITIDVNETTGVAGMVAPGSHVDVVSVISGGDHDKTLSRTIVGNVLIMAVGQRLSPNKGDGEHDAFKTVTLLVKPRQAEMIDLATTSTHTRLVLRGSGDEAPGDTEGVAFAELLGRTPESMTASTSATRPAPSTLFVDDSAARSTIATATPQRHTHTMRLINGGVISSVEFEIAPSAGEVWTGSQEEERKSATGEGD